MNEQFLPNESSYLNACRSVSDAAGGFTTERRRASPAGVHQLPLLLTGYARSGLAPAQPATVPVLRGALLPVTLFVCWLAAMPAHAQTGTIDLSLSKAISNQHPAVGNVVTYRVTVTNAPGSTTTATNVTVTDQLAAAGATYRPGSATGGWFSTTEVTKADQPDIDSTPGDGVVGEDDVEAVCFILPVFVYQGDEYVVAVPGGFDRIEWTRDGVPISSPAVSSSLATVNPDNPLTIRSIGVYTFTTYKDNCPSTNCYTIEMVPGQAGSLGDFVRQDLNANGSQDAGEPSIAGVPVTLMANGAPVSTTLLTDANGGCRFTNLTPGAGNSYAVGFTKPDGFTTTQPLSGTNRAKDPDADLVTGVSGSVTLANGEFNNTTSAFRNIAIASAMNRMMRVEDQSTAGANDDPDNGLDPRNNSVPTPVSLNRVNTTSPIGIAMAIRDTVRLVDGTFNVTYQIVVKNYGVEVLKNVTVSDTLAKVFNSLTGARYRLASPPVSIAPGSRLTLNPNFDGGANPLLVLGDSTSTLAAGQANSLLIVVNVATDGSTTTYLNLAYAEALASTGYVNDISTSGLNPDPNGNGNPTDANEREATALNLPVTSSALFIPEGFSPNGDGVNDLFIIRGTGASTISLEVYNRWGNLVYKNEDYRNDWDGRANTGILVGEDTNGLPVGTYFYKINLSDGRQFVRYMTINR